MTEKILCKCSKCKSQLVDDGKKPDTQPRVYCPKCYDKLNKELFDLKRNIRKKIFDIKDSDGYYIFGREEARWLWLEIDKIINTPQSSLETPNKKQNEECQKAGEKGK